MRQLLRGLVVLGIAVVQAGCLRIPTDGGSFTILSPWPEEERREVERRFRLWLGEGRGAGLDIAWVPLGPGEDLARVAVPGRVPLDLRARRFDFALGGPASSYRRLARAGRLVRVDGAEAPAWLVVRTTPIGMGVDPRRPEGGGTALDDPRHDPVALAWARGRLGSGRWAEGYAGLVREARRSPRIGRQAGSAPAAVERGEASRTPAVGIGKGRTRLDFVAEEGGGKWVEGAAILAGGDHPSVAREFLRFLAEREGAVASDGDEARDPMADDLLADLLGATLVDAQEELREAGEVLGRSKRRGALEAFLTEAPPWPPASVEKLLNDGSGELIETLAGQMAPDADVRAWLRRSWLAPKRAIDGRLLDELAAAADGRLAREPRFRAWLRAEWTAWARQRYRRVARVAGGRWP